MPDPFPQGPSIHFPEMALLAAIVESSNDAIISKGLSGIIQSWNSSAERIYGYTKAEAVGQPITMLIPEERLPEETLILEKIRRGERVDHFETVRVRKDGSRGCGGARNGHIRVTSAEGMGTCFTLRIPCAPRRGS